LRWILIVQAIVDFVESCTHGGRQFRSRDVWQIGRIAYVVQAPAELAQFVAAGDNFVVLIVLYRLTIPLHGTVSFYLLSLFGLVAFLVEFQLEITLAVSNFIHVFSMNELGPFPLLRQVFYECASLRVICCLFYSIS